MHTIAQVRSGKAELATDGHTLRFTPAGAGLGAVTFAVTDAAGDSMTRQVGIAVR